MEPNVTSLMLEPSLWPYIPALPPPSGVTPNFTNPENRGALGLIIGAILLGIMMFLYAVRLYVRCCVSRKLFWDDLTCTLSLVGVVTYYGSFAWACTRGPLGIHQWDLHLDRLWTKDWIISCYISIVLIAPIMLVIKLTFFLLYLYIFRQNAWIKMGVYIGAFITTIFYVSIGIARLVLVTPSHGTPWMESVLRSQHDKSAALSVPHAAVGLGIDVYILILPLGGVSQLHIPTHRKIQVCLVFTTGILACIASTLSTYYRVMYKRNKDVTWHTFDIQFLTCVEMLVGVICACMPSFSKMLHHHEPQIHTFKTLCSSFFHRLRSTLTRSGGKVTPSDDASLQKKSYQTLDFVPLNDVVVSTFVGSGQRIPVAEDVIYLKHEVEQREHRADS